MVSLVLFRDSNIQGIDCGYRDNDSKYMEAGAERNSSQTDRDTAVEYV